MKYAIIDFRTSEEEKCNLINLGFHLLVCPPSNLLYDTVCGHPDILLHLIDHHTIMVHKDMNINFIDKLKSLNFNVIFSKNSLANKYPSDIILNSVSLKNLFIHNIKYTDPNLLNYVVNKKLISVKQGYTKCSTAVVNENAIMTSDKSIAAELKKEKIDVLLLPPGDILLPGLDYGFIGGTCGFIDKNTLAFYGDLNCYDYGDMVLKFLEKHNITPVYLRKGKLVDRGSLFVVKN